MKKLFAALALLAALCLGPLFPATAHAAEPSAPNSSHTTARPSTVAPRGNDTVPVGITLPELSLFQCPVTKCNQGLAIRGQSVDDFCYLPTTTPWGGIWHLLIDTSNDEIGFASSKFITAGPGGHLSSQPCASVGQGVHMTLPALSLFQCPATNCNQGLAYRGDSLALVSTLWSDAHRDPWTGTGEWDILLDHSNNEVGMAAPSFIY